MILSDGVAGAVAVQWDTTNTCACRDENHVPLDCCVMHQCMISNHKKHEFNEKDKSLFQSI